MYKTCLSFYIWKEKTTTVEALRYANNTSLVTMKHNWDAVTQTFLAI